MPVSSSDATPKRRWFALRFRLRTLLLVVPLVVLGLGQLGISLGLADKEVHVFLEGTPRPFMGNTTRVKDVDSICRGIDNEYFISAALNRPEIASLPALRDKSDPVKWVRENLQVVSRDGEAELILRGADEYSLERIADALVQAYVEITQKVDREQYEYQTHSLRNLSKEKKLHWERVMTQLKTAKNRLATCEDNETAIEIKKEVAELSAEAHNVKLLYVDLDQIISDPMPTYPIDVAQPPEVVSGWDLLLGQE